MRTFKKKDVFVWVARDKDEKKWANIYHSKPVWYQYGNGDKGYWQNNKFANNPPWFIESYMGLKEGQCKKYKLVEVKK